MEEYRIMSPPRRPKGEKPRTTIRFLQAQQRHHVQLIAILRDEIAENVKRIGRYDVELSEAADREEILLREGDEVAEKYGQLLARHARDSLRRQFLEGYYHAKTETLPGSGAGHQGAHSDGAAAGEEGRAKNTAGRDGGATRDETWRFESNHPAPDNRRPAPRETDPDFFEVDGSHGPRGTRR